MDTSNSKTDMDQDKSVEVMALIVSIGAVLLVLFVAIVIVIVLLSVAHVYEERGHMILDEVESSTVMKKLSVTEYQNITIMIKDRFVESRVLEDV
ncbi:hypothetical protein QR680_016221 [Steinernema hermaphroditum]|uniref:Uncharacterized protein n=1 Tax=Steinernema hermaphroditum TaxID=289476 RepID=A0AA39HCF6_9BILA|nr:hypothetical protein QR680_016221 [Steinernema hermaphroditum]